MFYLNKKMFTMKRQQQADTKSQVQDTLAAWMAVKNKLSFAPGQPDVYSDKVRMKKPQGSPQWACAHMFEPGSHF